MDLTTDERRRLGRRGEDAAAEFLAAQGLTVIDRNWRCRDGEIDIVAFDEGTGTLVVVEVKTRRSSRFGGPLEAVDTRKLARLRRLAAAWLRAHEVRVASIRIDVVGVTCDRFDELSLQHVRGALG